MDGSFSWQAFFKRRQVPLIAGGGLLMAALLAVAYFTWIRQPYAVLFADLRTQDAATIVAELDRRKTPYELRDGGRTLLVPANLVDATRLSVMSEELPLKGVVGFELFAKSDMGLTEFAQRINYRRALQGEVARTIMALDTVESARVHLSLSEGAVFREDRRPAKASVTLIPRGGRSLPPATIRGVQRLTAAAVPDLAAADVVVLDETGAVISAVSPAAAPLTPPDVQARSAIENYYASRIRLLLRSLLPDGQAEVSVTAGDHGAGAGGVDPLAGWSPADRRFSLSVRVLTAAPVGPELRDEIAALAGRAIGLRPRVGDVVSVGYAPPAAPVTAEPAPAVTARAPETGGASRRPPLSSAASPTVSAWTWLAVPVIVLFLAVAVWLHRRSLGPRRMSARERTALAGRLGRLLEEGAADAVVRG